MSQNQYDIHHTMMQRAIDLAQQAAEKGEVPVGAVIYDDAGVVIAEAHNLVETNQDPSAHAEIVALRAAGKALGLRDLQMCNMVVTLEPCPMCAQAIAWAKIKTLRFGAYDVKSGGVDNGARIFGQTSCHHVPEVYGGLMEDVCGQLMTEFFKDKR